MTTNRVTTTVSNAYVRSGLYISFFGRIDLLPASMPDGLLTLKCYGSPNSGMQLAGCNLKKRVHVYRQSTQSQYDRRIAEILNTSSDTY
jgi:hypothetical protein